MIMTISSEGVPKAIGPYSQAIEANGLLLCQRRDKKTMMSVILCS